MKVGSVSSQSFGKISYGQSVMKNILSKKAERSSLLDLQKLTYALKNSTYGSTDSLDVIIEQAKDKSFYAVIIRENSRPKCTVMSLDKFLK